MSESVKIYLTIGNMVGWGGGRVGLAGGCRESVTSTPLPRIKPKIDTTHRGDVVRAHVPGVSHVVVGRHPQVGVVPFDGRLLQHEGLYCQQHV